MEEGSVLEQKIPDHFNAFIYVLEGAAEFGEKNTLGEAHHTVCVLCFT